MGSSAQNRTDRLQSVLSSWTINDFQQFVNLDWLILCPTGGSGPTYWPWPFDKGLGRYLGPIWDYGGA